VKARSYEPREGEKRTVMEIDVQEVGPSMKYASAKVTKTSRSGGGDSGGFGGGQQGGGSWGGQQSSSAGSDPWASSSTSGPAPF